MITDKRIIDLLACHSNYKLDSNANGIEYEAISHPNALNFARALINEAGKPTVTLGEETISMLRKGMAVEVDGDVTLIPASDLRPEKVTAPVKICVTEALVSMLRDGEKVTFDGVELIRGEGLDPEETKHELRERLHALQHQVSLQMQELHHAHLQIDKMRTVAEKWMDTATMLLKLEADRIKARDAEPGPPKVHGGEVTDPQVSKHSR